MEASNQPTHEDEINQRAYAHTRTAAIIGGLIGLSTLLTKSPRFPARLLTKLSHALTGATVASSGTFTYNMAQMAHDPAIDRSTLKAIKGESKGIGYGGAWAGAAAFGLNSARRSGNVNVSAMLFGGLAGGLTFYAGSAAKRMHDRIQSNRTTQDSTTTAPKR